MPAPRAVPEDPEARKAGDTALASLPPTTGPVEGQAPVVAIIIDDLGINIPATRLALRLPPPVTLSFLPYGYRLHELGGTARAAGDEVFLHLPMQPVGGADPGPDALVEGLSPAEIARRVSWALSQVPDADGVNNHMGSRLTADRDAMMLVMGDLAGRGLVFVDSLTASGSVAAATARSAGIPATTRDVFLDDDQSAAAIGGQLAKLETIARRTGSAVGIGHPYPDTLAVLGRWIPEARARGLRFVKASSIVALRTCGAEKPTAKAACMVPVAGPPPVRSRPT